MNEIAHNSLQMVAGNLKAKLVDLTAGYLDLIQAIHEKHNHCPHCHGTGGHNEYPRKPCPECGFTMAESEHLDSLNIQERIKVMSPRRDEDELIDDTEEVQSEEDQEDEDYEGEEDEEDYDEGEDEEYDEGEDADLDEGDGDEDENEDEDEDEEGEEVDGREVD